MAMAGLAVEIALWTCQAYAAWIFLKSARHKFYDFAEVGEEFRRWGYARPAEVTFAVVLIVAMLVAVAMGRWEPGVFQ